MTRLTLVIPVYNESRRLGQTFAALNHWQLPKAITLDKIIFVNDGSTDDTLKKIRSVKLKYPKQVISYNQNMGKGYAVKTGMLASKSPYTLFVDCDMSTPLDQIEKFIPYMNKGIDVVIGTRKNGHSTVIKHQPLLREKMGKVFTYLSQFILQVKVTDFTCGFKAFSKKAKDDIFKRSQINRWGYDSEVLFLATRLHYSLVERSVTWSDQKNSKVNLLKDAFKSFMELVEIRLSYFLNVYGVGKDLKLPEYNFN